MLWSLRTRAARAQSVGFYSDSKLNQWLSAGPPQSLLFLLQRGHVIVAEHDGKMVGYTAVDIEEALLEALFVAPEYFRQGYGSQLLECAEQLAKKKGTQVLTLSAALNAIDFYKAHGYELLAIQDRLHRSGAMLRQADMQKPLLTIAQD